MMARWKSETGTTMIEVAVASTILLVALLGLLSMGSLATVYTENHGHLEARTAEYAQDKMEQLLALAYTNQTSNTVVFPAATIGGTGMTPGGSVNTAAPVNGYVDWLGSDGSLLGGGTSAPTKWFYKRLWQISSPTTGLKQISVMVSVRSSVGGALLPKSTVTAVKAWQF